MANCQKQTYVYIFVFPIYLQTPQPSRQIIYEKSFISEKIVVHESPSADILPTRKNSTTSHPKFDELKKILLYNPYFSHADFEFGFGHEPFEKYECPVSNCYTTNNHSLLSNI